MDGQGQDATARPLAVLTKGRTMNAQHNVTAYDAQTWQALVALHLDDYLSAGRLTRQTPTYRDGSHDWHIGRTDLPTQDDGHDVTDDDTDAAAISETWTHDYREDWTEDGLTVVCIATLTTGCAQYVGPMRDDDGEIVATQHVGIAHGDAAEYRRLRTAARQDAEDSARAHRSACRASVRVIGVSENVRSAGWLDAESYGLLRAAVQRWTFGNAGHAGRSSGRQYVRAGITSNGMPLDVHTIDDATQNGALIIQRWMTRGLPESIENLIADLDADAASRVVIGTAARDGLRMTTQHRSATADARRRATWTARSASHDADGNAQDTTRIVRTSVGTPTYVASSSDGLRTDALLARLTARDADGRLTAPTLLHLFMADGNLDDVARMLGRVGQDGRCTRAARVAILKHARAEWDALTDGTTADDAAEWLDGLTMAR